jgi:hypothetical protein
MQNLYPWTAWDELRDLIIVVIVIGFCLDVMLCLLAFGGEPGDAICTAITCACCRGSPERQPLKQDSDSAIDTSGGLLALKCSLFATAVSTFILVLQLMMSVALFAFGFLLVVGKGMLGFACETVSDVVLDLVQGLQQSAGGLGEPLCVDLSVLGLAKVCSCDTHAHVADAACGHCASDLQHHMTVAHRGEPLSS